MKRIAILAVAAIVPFALAGAAMADPGDNRRDQWKLRAECDRKLARADSPREFHKEARECNKKLAELRVKDRRETLKAWRESEKDD